MLKTQDLTKILEALFAILIEVLYETLLLDDLGHILSESKLSSGVFCQPIIAFNDVFQKSSRRLVLNLGNDHIVQNCANS